MFYFVAATLLITSAVLVVIGLQSRSGKLRKNSLVGIRLPATMKNDDAWAIAQRTGWHWYIVNSAILAINGVGLIVLSAGSASNEAIAFWTLSWTVLLLTFAMIQAFRSSRAARRSS